MSVSIVDVTVGDDYTAAASIVGVANGNGGSYDVQSANVIYQLQEGPPGQMQWGPESFARPGGGTITAGATGIRFRNAAAGVVAAVTAYIAGPGQPTLQVSSTESGAGGVTVTSIVTPGAGVFVLPANASEVTVICVGGGGGGGGTGRNTPGGNVG
ncbi:MAG: hypothetical protein ACREES_00705, partial [Stellaceae bacterium]